MSLHKRVHHINPVPLDAFTGMLERKLDGLRQVSEARRYAILRSLITDLSEPDKLSNCFSEILLSRCARYLKKLNTPSAAIPLQFIKRQRLNIRRMTKTLELIQNPDIPLEQLTFKLIFIDSGKAMQFDVHSLLFTDRNRIQVERERQAAIGWEGLLSFVRHLFEISSTADLSVIRNLAEGIIWESRKNDRKNWWLWGLFVSGNQGVTERVILSLFQGGTGDVSLNATRIDDSVEGEKLRISIEHAKWAAAHYVQRLTTGYREDFLSFDTLLQIGDSYQPEGYHGASLGLQLSVLIVAHLIQAPIDMDTAFTGEIDLEGNVYSVSGIPEKIQAARSRGVKRVFIPAADLQALTESELKDLDIIGIRTLEETCDILFRDILINKGYRAFPLAASSVVQSEPSITQTAPLIGRKRR